MVFAKIRGNFLFCFDKRVSNVLIVGQLQ